VQITITRSYGVPDFKADLALMYTKVCCGRALDQQPSDRTIPQAGLKNIALVFLLTDAQIVMPEFLVYMNDFLSTGYVPDLFAQDERDNLVNGVRSEVKAAGLIDTPDVCWDFFIDRVRLFSVPECTDRSCSRSHTHWQVRRNLHVVMCFSPVGEDFRVRGRRFPAVFTCTVIDWFHAWPEEALERVARNFLQELEIDSEVKEKVVKFMAYAQGTVKRQADQYKAQERRFYYTTPKSYLELIALYKRARALRWNLVCFFPVD
jgi:dynein heavy chain